MSKRIEFGAEARKKLVKGIETSQSNPRVNIVQSPGGEVKGKFRKLVSKSQFLVICIFI